ncbi:MAG TPA: carboxypeptidase-like regulatory domain-containing protein [Candidatus Acidoferrales bacterium]|nr:carboxypeptidase-like regulatory domain-containing protein [Candidatus Acidoferrales bacterium]
MTATLLEELSSFALLVGSVVDATTVAAPYTPQPPRSPVSVNFSGIGTPPTPTDAVFARAFAADGFVLAFDAADVAVDDRSSSGPSPKHLAGAFDIHFVISAEGYADLPVVYACNKDALPIAPAPYALQPNAVAIAGRVTASGTALAGAVVQITAESPSPGMLPAAVTTAADGTFAIENVPAAQTATISASGGGYSGSQTISLSYPNPLVTVSFEF